MHLKIKVAENEEINYLSELYENHHHFHEGDAGLDLYMPRTFTVAGGSRGFMISLDISCEPFLNKDKEQSVSFYLYPRSSISKTPLRMSNSVGIIDAGYRGNLIVAVDNISDEAFEVRAGTRLFQICGPTLEPISYQLSDELSDTTRGSGGFGSTGQ